MFSTTLNSKNAKKMKKNSKILSKLGSKTRKLQKISFRPEKQPAHLSALSKTIFNSLGLALSGQLKIESPKRTKTGQKYKNVSSV